MRKHLFLAVVIGCTAVSGCAARGVLAGATLYEFRGKQYLVFDQTSAGIDLTEGGVVEAEEFVAVKGPDGRWSESSKDSYLIERIRGNGKLVKRIRSSRVRTTPGGGFIITEPRSPEDARIGGDGHGH